MINLTQLTILMILFVFFLYQYFYVNGGIWLCPQFSLQNYK